MNICVICIIGHNISDLSAKAFLAAFDRFAIRRGPITDMYSDNQLAFVGGTNEMNRTTAEWNRMESSTHQELIDRNIRWHFGIPLGPHMRGLMEACVKSVKFHYKRELGGTLLTFEQLNTILVRIEACLNSRPITSLKDDPSDLTALTPGHFTNGTQILRPYGPNVREDPPNRLDAWERMHQIEQRLCHRWQNDYLHELRQRNKWYQPKRSLQINDLVFLKNDNAPPGEWMLGRVIQTHTGPDGMVRSVRIRTQKNQYDRPVTKCCYLPLEGSREANIIENAYLPEGFATSQPSNSGQLGEASMSAAAPLRDHSAFNETADEAAPLPEQRIRTRGERRRFEAQQVAKTLFFNGS